MYILQTQSPEGYTLKIAIMDYTCAYENNYDWYIYKYYTHTVQTYFLIGPPIASSPHLIQFDTTDQTTIIL